MGIRKGAIRAIGRGFDVERKVKDSPIDKIILLKRDGTTKPYSEMKVYTNGFIVRYNSFRNQSEIEIATEDDLSQDVLNLMAIAVISGATGKIHAATDGDVVPPDDSRFTWMFYGSIRANEIYTPEV